MIIEHSRQSGQQGRQRQIVALRDPDVVAPCMLQAERPLSERAAAVFGIDDARRYVGVVAIVVYYSLTVVGAAVIQQDDLDVLNRLRQYGIDALAKEPRVVVARYDDGDFGWHGCCGSRRLFRSIAISIPGVDPHHPEPFARCANPGSEAAVDGIVRTLLVPAFGSPSC